MQPRPAPKLEYDQFCHAVQIASKSFIPGFDNIRVAPLELMFFPEKKPKPDPNVSFKCDANLIPGTRLVASAGPNISYLNVFLNDTVFNEQFPIHHIIALGISSDNDFNDYASDLEEFDDNGKVIQEVKVNLDEVGLCQFDENTQSIYQKFLWTIKRKEATTTLNISNYLISDGSYFNLGVDADKTLTQSLWDLFVMSLQNNTLVHCKAGLGRTGHLIYMFRVLKKLIAGFDDTTPEQIAKALNDDLFEMRSVRPGLLLSHDQFSFAARNAFAIYSYASQLKLVDAIKHLCVPEPRAVTPLVQQGLFKNPATVVESELFTAAEMAMFNSPAP